MKQTARIISTYSADVMGVCSALFELGGMTVMHDASGCNSTYTTHDEPRWYDMDSMVYISGLSEIEAIMGDDEKLISDITDAAEELRPAFIALAGTPIPAMTGFDYEAVAGVIEKRSGIPCFGIPTTGMNSYVHGAYLAFECLAKRFVDAADGEGAGSKFKVNILGLTPLGFSVNGTDRSIAAWLESEGFEVVSKWAMGSSLDEIRRSAEADVNLVVSSAGLGAAAVLRDRFGIPYVTGVPIGDRLKAVLAGRLKENAERGRKGELCGDGGTEGSDCADCSFAAGIEAAAGMTDKEGMIAVIGEGVTSMSLAAAIEAGTGRKTKVLCATDLCGLILRPGDCAACDEDEIIPELEGASAVIADPLYRPIVPEGVKFIELPDEAFSGRIFRKDIPDLVKDCGVILNRL